MLDKILGKEIASYLRKYKFLILCAILPAAIAAFSAIVPAEILPSLIDSGMSTKTEPASLTIKIPVWDSDSSFPIKMEKRDFFKNSTPNSLLIKLAIIFLISTIVKSIAVYISRMAAAAFSNRAIRTIRIDLYNKFISLHQGFFHEQKIGVLISRSTADLTVLQASISNIIIGLVMQPLMALLFLLSALKMNYRLTLILMITAPILLGLVRMFGRKVKKHAKKVQESTADVTSAYQETLLCLKIVQGFCTAKHHSSQFQELVNILYKKTMRWNRWLRGTAPMMDSVIAFIIPTILIFGKIYFNHTFGELAGLFYALSRTYTPVRLLAEINNELKTIQGATERVFGILNTKSDIEDKDGAVILPRHNKTIEFKNVSFYYKKEIPIIQGISFTVKAGEMVAFVGSTGAGKSTLMDLIPRFYDVTEGQILVDGMDIRDVTIESLRMQMGIVSQEVLLFHDTILNNISCRSSNIDMKDIIDAATAAHAHDFIMAQPYQYETVVGDRGSLLSGGQKQRISIARAILTRPSILILDEVASALDAESEELIQKAIESLKSKCTIFAVAHRLSTIRNADRIFVLENGKIVESGTHNELMALDGRFKQLHHMQFQS